MKDNEMKEKEMKLQFYFEKQITIHIENSSDKFYNGLILEILKDMIVLNDRFIGEIPIPLSEIKVIDRFREKDSKEVKE